MADDGLKCEECGKEVDMTIDGLCYDCCDDDGKACYNEELEE